MRFPDRRDCTACPKPIALGILQALNGLLERIWGISLRAGPACNMDGISRLVEFQGTFEFSRRGLMSAGFTFKTYWPRCESSYFASTCSIVPIVSGRTKFSMTTTSLGCVTAK